MFKAGDQVTWKVEKYRDEFPYLNDKSLYEVVKTLVVPQNLQRKVGGRQWITVAVTNKETGKAMKLTFSGAWFKKLKAS